MVVRDGMKGESMTIDEAIIHAEEVAEIKKTESETAEIQGCNRYALKCEECASEHRQLAEWLRDYKRLKEQEPSGDLISRQAAIDAFERFIHELGIKDEPYNYGEMVLSVENISSVKPQTGHWIMQHRKVNTINYRTGEDVLTGEIHTVKELIRYECDEPYCSECGKRAGDTSGNYCCFCGARMESEQNG